MPGRQGSYNTYLVSLVVLVESLGKLCWLAKLLKAIDNWSVCWRLRYFNVLSGPTEHDVLARFEGISRISLDLLENQHIARMQAF